MKSLPRKLDTLHGLRAASWIRESTVGQYDNFGPDAQREQVARAVERFGLVYAGIEWLVSHSGRTVASTVEWQDMLERAGRDYDVLVVGYASRFSRDARTAFNARHDLHSRDATLLFADERLLSSDDDSWDYWAKEAVEAESYSRRMGRRVREGLEAKRRRLGTPGGNRPPFGFGREGRPPILVVDPERMAVVRQAYELGATGMLDREVAARVGLKLMHIREILTNPVYRGRLHRGELARTGPAVDPSLWDTVQVVRSRWKRRHPGYPVNRREYALAGLLFCAGCGRRIIGDTGRYRHTDPCPAFVEARPEGLPPTFPLVRIHGHSYPADTYDGIVPAVLEHVASNAIVKASVLGLLAEQTKVDFITLARIAKDRETAMSRYLKDRDARALDGTMARLDIEEAEACEASTMIDAKTALDYLADLPGLWRKTAPERRRNLTEAIFERIEVLGVKEAIITPTPEAEAHGWREAWGDAVLTAHRDGYGRGERS